MHPKVDDYLEKVNQWQDELTLLRSIILDCDLEEDFKWMHPCYTYNGKNVVLIHEFNDYCAILFQKGVLLKDPEKILVQQTKNVQSARQLRFTNVQEIQKLKSIVRTYIYEAIEVEKSGLEVKLKKTADFEVPEELNQKFEQDPNFKIAFKDLTPGRQKGYLLHFAQPKQSKTRISRIENHHDRIMMGKGIRDCICGHSKRYPNCDGSHKKVNQSEWIDWKK